MTPAISVIVPVYNVEKTLDRCVKSILSQTFQDFEIILIDDGSTDQSGLLCDRYAHQDLRISVIHKANEGLGPTRNAGIRAARGTYVYHCDSDDWLEPDLLELAYRRLEESQADCAIFGYQIFTERQGKQIPYATVSIPTQIYADAGSIRRLFIQEYFHYFIVLSACNRVCRRSFLIENDLFFPDLRRCQDMAYSLSLFDRLQSLVTIEEALYCYVIEPGVFKGRDFMEKVGNYATVHTMTTACFQGWGMLSSEIERKLNDYTCEQIANYAAYALSVTFRDENRKNARLLLRDDQIRSWFAQYGHQKKSRFMLLFCIATRLRSPWLLTAVCELAHRRQQKITSTTVQVVSSDL